MFFLSAITISLAPYSTTPHVQTFTPFQYTSWVVQCMLNNVLHNLRGVHQKNTCLCTSLSCSGKRWCIRPLHRYLAEPIALADPRGHQGRPPPRESKFFHFHAVFGKKLKNNSNFWELAHPHREHPGNATELPSMLCKKLGNLCFNQTFINILLWGLFLE